MEFVFVWLICGIIAAMIGAKKDTGCAGFLVGVLLGPFGIVLALVMKGDRVRCPYCRELMHKKATVCPHCQRDMGVT
jgi:hypothetical protein